MTRLPLAWLLPLLLALVLASAAGWPPVVDEESYLDIAAQLAEHPARPYDWSRPWQPWGASPPEQSYLFAHPPLHLWWLSAWTRVLPLGPGLRLAVGLPWALLLGWAAASLARRSGATRGAWIWLTSPVLVLGLQSSLMIDLPVLALGTAGLAAWQRAAQGAGPRWALSAGLLLRPRRQHQVPPRSCSCPRSPSTPPADIVLRRTLPVWFGVALTWGALELFLLLQYGSIHMIHVLKTAEQIGRGPLLGRLAGTGVRLGLLASPALALLVGRRALAGGLAAALFAAAAIHGQLEPGGLLICAALAFAGGALLTEALLTEALLTEAPVGPLKEDAEAPRSSGADPQARTSAPAPALARRGRARRRPGPQLRRRPLPAPRRPAPGPAPGAATEACIDTRARGQPAALRRPRALP
ncbi:MAG: hypothetical protein H6741_14955 [Alphaproteobacteria bacterium]|nr:hypothetical protein [Alphaproteobacteria bacterium]